MKKKSIVAIVATSVIIFNLSSCVKSNKTIIRAQHLEEGVSNPQTIEEYEEAISKYEARIGRIEETIADLQIAKNQVAIWNKIVGTRYLDRKLYGDALKSFQAALEYTPDNQNLYYYVGLCAAYMSQQAMDYEATGDHSKRQNYLNLAEDAYKRAIFIEPRYSRALYAIAVLYDFELEEPAKAIPHLETLLTIEKNHLDGLVLLARCYYETYQFDKAIETYDRIIETTKVAERKDLARQLKAQVEQTKQEFGE